MKVILVTGGNRGLGLEICKQLDALGHIVIMGARNIQSGLIAGKNFSDRLKVAELDVTDPVQIDKCFDMIKTHYGKLDVLINNAGLGEQVISKKNESRSQLKTTVTSNIKRAIKSNPFIDFSRIRKRKSILNVSKDQLEILMETNFYGPVQMCQAFVPILSKSEDARIINISSGNGQTTNLPPDYPAYSLSKATLNAFTIMLAKELHNSNIRVNAMCPGWIKTDMGGADAARTVSQGAETAIWLSTAKEIETGKFYQDKREIPW